MNSLPEVMPGAVAAALALAPPFGIDYLPQNRPQRPRFRILVF